MRSPAQQADAAAITLASNQQHDAALRQDGWRRFVSSSSISPLHSTRALDSGEPRLAHRQSHGTHHRRQLHGVNFESLKTVRHHLVPMLVLRVITRHAVVGVLLVMAIVEVAHIRLAHRAGHKPEVAVTQASEAQRQSKKLRHQQQHRCCGGSGPGSRAFPHRGYRRTAALGIQTLWQAWPNPASPAPRWPSLKPPAGWQNRHIIGTFVAGFGMSDAP